MDEGSKAQQAKAEKRLIVFIAVAIALGLIATIASWFDNTTELIPNHDDVLQSCFVIGGVAGLVFGALSVRLSSGLAAWRRVAGTCAMMMMGFLLGFVVSSSSADIIKGRLDFPPARTRTYTRLFVIWRAYHVADSYPYLPRHTTPHWNIQTTPIWSDLEVTQADYDFMLTHRDPDDHGRDPGEISSHGYFCARVEVQQSGNALRIMHAGSRTLPTGTVIICPTTPHASALSAQR